MLRFDEKGGKDRKDDREAKIIEKIGKKDRKERASFFLRAKKEGETIHRALI